MITCTWSDAYNVPMGNYSVMVIDSLGCKKNIKFSIESPKPINISLYRSLPNVDSSFSGEAKIEVMGGTPPYNYLWLPDSQVVASISYITGGNYSVTVVDHNECSRNIPVVIPLTTNCPQLSGCYFRDELTSCNISTVYIGDVVLDIVADFGADPNDQFSDECAFEAANNYINSYVCGNSAVTSFTLTFPAGQYPYFVGRQIPFGTAGNNCYYAIGHDVFYLGTITNCGGPNQPIIFKGIPAPGSGDLPEIRFEDCMSYGSFVPQYPLSPYNGYRYLPCGAFNDCGYTAFPGNLFKLGDNNPAHTTYCENVTFQDLNLNGNIENFNIGGRSSDITEGIEHQYSGIVINNGTNITINNVNIHNFGYCGLIAHSQNIFTNINLVLKNSKFNNSCCTGFVWSGGSGVYATNCQFNSNGIYPFVTWDASGMLIESFNILNPSAHGSFYNCEFKLNYRSGVLSNIAAGQEDFTFERCLFVGSESGPATVDGQTSNLNARYVSYTCCDFYGPMSIVYDAPISFNNLNDWETRFRSCSFNEEYIVNGITYSFTSDCIAPDPDNFSGNEDCDYNDEPLADHQPLVSYGGNSYARVNFNSCAFNTNYNNILCNLNGRSSTGGLSFFSNYQEVRNCIFTNSGLNVGRITPTSCGPSSGNRALLVLQYVNFVGSNILDYRLCGNTSDSWVRNPIDPPLRPKDYRWTVYDCCKNSIAAVSLGALVDLNLGNQTWMYLFDGDVPFLARTSAPWCDYLPCHKRYTNPSRLQMISTPPCSTAITLSPLCSGIGNRNSQPVESKTELNKIKVFPIPATSVINVVEINENEEVCLYNIVGDLLLKKISLGKELIVDIRQFSPGIYIIKVNGKLPQKIIKTTNE